MSMHFVLLCKKIVLKRYSVCMHSGLILGSHTYVHLQVPNAPLNDITCEKLGCFHKLQTIYDTSSHILSIFLKVAFAIKFALKWRAAPRCAAARRSRRSLRVLPCCAPLLIPGRVLFGGIILAATVAFRELTSYNIVIRMMSREFDRSRKLADRVSVRGAQNKGLVTTLGCYEFCVYSIIVTLRHF